MQLKDDLDWALQTYINSTAVVVSVQSKELVSGIP